MTLPNTSADLLPCPFCGADPTPDFSSIQGEAAYHFHCQSSSCPAWPNVQGETEAEAIAAWNTRAAPNTSADEMRATAWTPGPWAAEGMLIAKPHYQSDPIAWVARSLGDKPEMLRANARLIAAAPALYEALEKMRGILRALQPALNVMASEVLNDIIADQIEPALSLAREGQGE